METTPDNQQINLKRYWLYIKQRKIVYLGSIALLTLIGTMSAFFVPLAYKSTAVIFPISSGRGFGEETSDSGGMQSVLLGISGLLSKGGSSSGKFLAILQSRTLTRKVINDLNLLPDLYPDLWDDAAQDWKAGVTPPHISDAVNYVLEKKFEVAIDPKIGTIEIKTYFSDPALTTKVMNAYLANLDDFISNKAFTVGKRQRIFLGELLMRNRKELLESAKLINDFYNRFNVRSAQSDLDVELTLDIAAPESVIDAMNRVKKSRTRLHSVTSVKQVPQKVYFDYLSSHVALLKEINSILTIQYENAKVEEAREALSFQVVDQPIEPHVKYFPKPKFFFIISFLLSGLLVTFLTIFTGSLKDPKQYLRRVA